VLALSFHALRWNRPCRGIGIKFAPLRADHFADSPPLKS
jgi:hypothetical protein